MAKTKIDWQRNLLLAAMAATVFMLINEWSDYQDRRQPVVDTQTTTSSAPPTFHRQQKAHSKNHPKGKGKTTKERASIHEIAKVATPKKATIKQEKEKTMANTLEKDKGNIQTESRISHPIIPTILQVATGTGFGIWLLHQRAKIKHSDRHQIPIRPARNLKLVRDLGQRQKQTYH